MQIGINGGIEEVEIVPSSFIVMRGKNCCRFPGKEFRMYRFDILWCSIIYLNSGLLVVDFVIYLITVLDYQKRR